MRASVSVKTVLLTGASGRIGQVIREGLRDVYSLVLFNRSSVDDLLHNEKLVRGDVADDGAVEEAMAGVDAVVHLAGEANEASFRQRLLPANLLGTYNVFEAARTAGVRRVVYASSNHAVGFHPVEEVLDEKTTWYPDSMYGVTKCFGEATGRYYAKAAGMEVVCLRIGSFQERPKDERQLATWISYPDTVRLVRCALEAPHITYEVVYGVSNNTRNRWDLTRARRVLGYNPVDDAETYAEELLKGPDEEWEARVRYHGGPGVPKEFMP